MKRLAIVLLTLICLTGGAAFTHGNTSSQQEPKVDAGKINGAPYRIEIPAAWNKGLVIYCHGYEVKGTPAGNADHPFAKAIRNVFLSRGFAFAESAYSTQGWAVREAVEDTEAMRRYFVTTYGQPRETIVTGHSMGAVISLATVERFPEVYDGAMPMCGPLSPILDFVQERVFDVLVTFEFYFPGVVASPIDIPADFKFTPAGSEKVRAAVQAAPEKAAMFARRYNVKVSELHLVLSFFQEVLRELKQRAGGNAVDNRNTIYSGFDDDAAVNRGVKRYAADEKARDYIRRYYTPTGRISDPVLTVHTTYDPLIPGRDVNYYNVIAGLAGTQDMFVQKFVVADGHCNINAARTGAAFDSLLIWIREKKRPAAGELQ